MTKPTLAFVLSRPSVPYAVESRAIFWNLLVVLAVCIFWLVAYLKTILFDF